MYTEAFILVILCVLCNHMLLFYVKFEEYRWQIIKKLPYRM